GGSSRWAGRGGVDVGPGNEFHPSRAARLGEKQGADLPRPDQADGNRTARGLPFEQHGVEIHGMLRALKSMQSLLQTSRALSSVTMARRRRCAGSVGETETAFHCWVRR